jgi:hypothetical protein
MLLKRLDHLASERGLEQPSLIDWQPGLFSSWHTVQIQQTIEFIQNLFPRVPAESQFRERHCQNTMVGVKQRPRGALERHEEKIV